MATRSIRARAFAALLIILGVISVGCGAASEPGSSDAVPVSSSVESDVSTSAVTPGSSTIGVGVFDAADAAMRERISTAGLGGGVLRVVHNGELVHDLQVGRVTGTTPMSVASAAKWLTAATLMTLVDDGAVALDDGVARWLPEFAEVTPAVTVRQLLIHTSGVRDRNCLWSGTPLADCVREIAAAAKQFPAGSAYSYGNADFHVIGRLIEVLAGTDFATAVSERITRPLGMESTTWPGAPRASGPAAGLRTTVEDYLRFLALIAGHGAANGRRLLSEAAVETIVSDQLGGYDTSTDFAVRITRIPRYGLGCWPDVVDERGSTIVVSGNGATGFYPWVDFATNSYGVVGVQDDRGAQLAVPASQKVAVIARSVLG